MKALALALTLSLPASTTFAHSDEQRDKIVEAVGEGAADSLLTTREAINTLAENWAKGTFDDAEALELATSFRRSAELCAILVEDKSAPIEAATASLIEQATALETWIKTKDDSMAAVFQDLRAATDRQLLGAGPAAPTGDSEGTISLQITASTSPGGTKGKLGSMLVKRGGEGMPLEVTWEYADGTSDKGLCIPFPNSGIMAVTFGTGAKTLSIYRRDGTAVTGLWATTSPDAKINEINLSQGATRTEYQIEGGGTFRINAVEDDVAAVTWSYPYGDIPGIGISSGDFLALISCAPDSEAGVGLYTMSPDAKTATGLWAKVGTPGTGAEELTVTAMTGTFLAPDEASIEHELKQFAAAFHKDLAAAADLRPTPEQIAAIAATAEGAEKLAAYVDAVYAQLTPGQPAADPAQTEIIFGGPDLDDLPGGYSQHIAHFKPGTQFYSFQYVKPGETRGMSYDGLCRLDGTWVFIPKAWRAFAQ